MNMSRIERCQPELDQSQVIEITAVVVTVVTFEQIHGAFDGVFDLDLRCDRGWVGDANLPCADGRCDQRLQQHKNRQCSRCRGRQRTHSPYSACRSALPAVRSAYSRWRRELPFLARSRAVMMAARISLADSPIATA